MRSKLKNHFIPHKGNNFKPHFVRERNLVGVALLSIAIFGLAFSLKSVVNRYPDLLSAVITGVLVDITNINRTNEHLVPLKSNPVLVAAAQLKANDMASKSYFSHNSPDGKSPWYWFSQSGYDFIYAGENLAVNFSDSEEVVRAWMNSPSHKANILNGKFTETGIAIASGMYNGQQSIYVVQLFGQPAPQPSPISIKNEIVVPNKVAPKPTPKVTPTVSGVETSVKNLEVVAEDKEFVAVKNNDYVAAPSVVGKVLTSPKVILRMTYAILATLVLVALALFVFIKPWHLHNKHAVYATLVLVLIVSLAYISSTNIFPQILIK